MDETSELVMRNYGCGCCRNSASSVHWFHPFVAPNNNIMTTLYEPVLNPMIRTIVITNSRLQPLQLIFDVNRRSIKYINKL